MSYARLEELGGLQWPCPDEDHPGTAVPARAAVGADPGRGRRARRSASSRHEPPVEALDDEFPIRLTTGRRLDSYNTGVQTGGYTLAAPPRRDARRSRPRTPRGWASPTASVVRVTSRRGAVEAPVRIDPRCARGLAFMTFHFPDEVDANLLTIDATDPKSGTAEFKATAVRVDELDPQSATVVERPALHATPSPRRRSERCTVDAVAAARSTRRGPADGRVGERARDSVAGRRGGHARSGERRHLLLPALHAVQERVGLDQPGRAQLHLPRG